MKTLTTEQIFLEDDLKKIFDLQMAFMARLRDEKNFHSFPLKDLHTQANQAILREILGYFVMELSEASEAYVELFNLTNSLTDQDLSEKESIIKPLITAFNKELMDSLNFLVEFFIFCGLDYSDIKAYYENWLSEHNLLDSWFYEDNTMMTIMTTCRNLNIQDGYYGTMIPSRCILFNEPDVEFPLLMAGKNNGPQHQTVFEAFLWDITRTINLAGNELKNQAWETETQTNKTAFNSKAMNAFISFFRMLDFLGYESLSIYLACEETHKRINKKLDK